MTALLYPVDRVSAVLIFPEETGPGWVAKGERALSEEAVVRSNALGRTSGTPPPECMSVYGFLDVGSCLGEVVEPSDSLGFSPFALGSANCWAARAKGLISGSSALSMDLILA